MLPFLQPFGAELPALGPSWMDPNHLLAQYGTALIWVTLAILFIECGLLFPILPGDSLLFAIGLFIATDTLPISLWLALILLFAAAFLGNVVGYEIGRALGPAIYRHDGRIIKRRYWDQTHDFFERHGNKALVIGRFVPIVRTFVTVIAGIGRMDRRRFLTWSAVGAALWVASVTFLGYFLGQAFPVLQDKLDVAVVLVVLVSLVPAGMEWWPHRRGSEETSDETADETTHDDSANPSSPNSANDGADR